MSLWQVVGANRATLAGLGYRVYRVPGAPARYGAAAADVDADVDADSRSFCLSREKLNMQQLNRRLASYLQQVQCLEAANQRLEQEIQEELDRKCPRERRQLDGHLRTVSLLRELISEAISAQAQVKLQLLGAELTIHDFNVRCEKQREQRGRVEAELSNLRCLDEDLKIQTLPELQSLISDQEQHLVQLQIQHQQVQ
ncbi:keratin, type I cytoskeletal 18-like [Sander vitreus]